MSKFKTGDLVVIIRSKQTKICYQYSDVFQEELKINLNELYGKVGTITGFGCSEIITNECYFVKLNGENITIRVYESNLKITSYFAIKQKIESPETKGCDKTKRSDTYMNKSIVEMWRKRTFDNLRRIKKEIEDKLIINDQFVSCIESHIATILINLEEINIPIGDKPEIKITINDMDAHECITESTRTKIEQVRKSYVEEADRIDNMLEELYAMIQDCETYGQSMSILESYGIVQEDILHPKKYDKSFFHIDE